MEDYGLEVLVKTPGLYEVPKLRNTTTTTATTTTTTNTWDHWHIPVGGPRENPRSLSSPKAEKFEFDFFLYFSTDGQTYTIS